MGDEPGLLRRLGTGDPVVIGLGSMIGAGVFAAFAPPPRGSCSPDSRWRPTATRRRRHNTTSRIRVSSRSCRPPNRRGTATSGTNIIRAPPSLNVGDARDQRLDVAVGVARGQVDQSGTGQLLGLDEGELDRGDGVVLVGRRRDVPPQFVLRPVVPAAGQPPRPAGGGLELGEVQLPHLVRAGRLDPERSLPPGREPTAFPLVVRLQQQPLRAQQPQHAGRGHRQAVVAAHRPHLPVAPRRMRQRMESGSLADAVPGRPRPRTFYGRASRARA
jgi:hypothetical protein